MFVVLVDGTVARGGCLARVGRAGALDSVIRTSLSRHHTCFRLPIAFAPFVALRGAVYSSNIFMYVTQRLPSIGKREVSE